MKTGTSLTDTEIIKAFECCYLYDVMFCDKCPNKNTCGVIDVAKSTLDLINRQQAEIENYKTDKEEYIKDYIGLENNLKYSEQERKFEHQRVVHLQTEMERLRTSIKDANSYFSEGDFAKGIAIVYRLTKEMECK